MAHNNYVIAFDVGLTGYYSLLQEGKVLESNKLEVELKEDFLIKTNTKTKSKVLVKNQLSFLNNFNKLKDIVNKYNLTKDNCLVICEQLTPRPFNSRVSVMSLGDSGAVCRSLAQALNLDFLIVSPGSWKKDFNLSSDKQESINYLMGITDDDYGSLEIGDNVNLNYKNHNQVESILIAHWQLRYL